MKSITLLLLALCSSSAWAVVDGTPLNWGQHDNTVYIDGCTGTFIGGRYVLTAAHCYNQNDWAVMQDADNNIYYALDGDFLESSVLHPNYQAGIVSEDVALVKLNREFEYTTIQFFKDLATPGFEQDATFTLDGFGGTDNVLHRAEFKMSRTSGPSFPFYIGAWQTGIAHATQGDSGGAWVNNQQEIFAITQGGGFDSVQQLHEVSGIDLHYVKDFLLEHINGWHYPTVVNGQGRVTVEVQSLHLNPVSDSAYTSGNVTLISESSSCLDGAINAFERCQYVLDVQGQGALHLSSSEKVKLNPNASNGDDGGSLGLWSVMAFTILGWRRRYGLKKTLR
ncbi:trypsin-like serine protease [Vibrio sp. TBV020]|uniref:trypsin-like serine protease n=1 Tax=Vibrio sp. TBV020 TaxID=3137398 RepID=UPI0038CD82DB